jgi:hypothetical protein
VPALPDVPKVLKLALVHLYGANLDVVTRHYIAYSGSAPSDADLNAFCEAVRNNWDEDVKPLCSDDVELKLVEATDLTTVTSAIGSFATSVEGTRTGTPIPAASCVVQSYEIARRYRGGHPRGYWPCGVNTDLAGSLEWSSDAIADFQPGLDAYFADALASGWGGAGTLTHVNVSYYEGFTVVTDPITGRARNVPTPRDTPVIDTISSTIVRARVGSQRRRNPS